ncbi:hypothetical protein [Tenacibaculum jejuense]|uniref:DUF4199 domain-containing protein n=1 Tax=Tenacibaculum jejuense TaxID=584609 RepID=A0A238U8D0_9FLAO|nr:hypothetical protein [Tenacibaculum jejuense]SNR15246.1 conserved membrane protein of unknown function [Tenacibaculum jejuense]
MDTNKIILKNGFLIYSCIVIFFLLMKILGLDNVSELRFLNFLFVFWGVNRAIKQNINLNAQDSYFNNFYVGFGSSVIGIALTIIGLIVYVGFIEPSFITVLENSSLWGKKLSLEMVVFALTIEGIASSVMCSFILMQYYKNYKSANILTS